MAKYITEIDVSVDENEEQQLKARGFNKIDVNLNEGAGGKRIYLWYKKGTATITRMQVSFNDKMAIGLTNAGYKKIEKDVNDGAGGDYIYLWYYSVSAEYDTPIVDLNITVNADDEAPLYKLGWERLGCDLNRKSQGNFIYLWVKREKPTYICDVTATNSFSSDAVLFKDGYTRVDEDINRRARGEWVFIWYRKTTSNLSAVTSLEISTNDSEYQELPKQGYQPVVNVNLNEGTGGDKVFLWYKADAHDPIQAISVLINIRAVEAYEKHGVQVIRKDLNSGTKGVTEYLAFYR